MSPDERRQARRSMTRDEQGEDPRHARAPLCVTLIGIRYLIREFHDRRQRP